MVLRRWRASGKRCLGRDGSARRLGQLGFEPSMPAKGGRVLFALQEVLPGCGKIAPCLRHEPPVIGIPPPPRSDGFGHRAPGRCFLDSSARRRGRPCDHQREANDRQDVTTKDVQVSFEPTASRGQAEALQGLRIAPPIPGALLRQHPILGPLGTGIRVSSNQLSELRQASPNRGSRYCEGDSNP